jgi:hypothetical protein
MCVYYESQNLRLRFHQNHDIYFEFIIVQKGRSVHVNRVGPANTLKNEKKKKHFVLLSWFSGTPYAGTQQNRSDKMHR